MKVAVVYNRESQSVINLFGLPNREKIGQKTIDRVVAALKEGGHQPIALEGDKDLVDNLEEFMPRVLKGERPGLVFNVSYGIQGQARYTHVPSILEMVGIPYVASGPLAHSLALDKVVTKMILRQNNLPTPDFAVLQAPDSPIPELHYPIVVKPKNEAVSFGLKVVDNEEDLREAAKVIFDKFGQAVLAEQYIEGREINVGLLGNDPVEAFPPVELSFGEDGPRIYTYEDKTGKSGRTIQPICPAPIGEKLTLKAQALAKDAYAALGISDCARVDMRMDKDSNLYILEVNSLPSLGEHGSYLVGAAEVGLDFGRFINRLVEVASSRYFGTPHPPEMGGESKTPAAQTLSYITERRDQIERSLKSWTNLHGRTSDPVGLQQGMKRAEDLFTELRLTKVPDLSDGHFVNTFQTAGKLDDGVLVIGNLDVPIDVDIQSQGFRREPEWLYGEGIGSSRAPFVMLEFAMRALRATRRLRNVPLGVLCYADEGHHARYSAKLIQEAAQRAREVIILRPGNIGDLAVTQRRGQRRYRFRAVGDAQHPGRYHRKPDVLRWSWAKLEELAALTSQNKRVSVSTIELSTERLPMRLPHRVTANILLTYPSAATADRIEEQMRSILGKGGPKWELETLTDRPPFIERPAGLQLAHEYKQIADEWEIPFATESSVWPSVAGLLPTDKPCLCGVGPVARDLRTPQEAVFRISLVQRTILLAEFLLGRLRK